MSVHAAGSAWMLAGVVGAVSAFTGRLPLWAAAARPSVLFPAASWLGVTSVHRGAWCPAPVSRPRRASRLRRLTAGAAAAPSGPPAPGRARGFIDPSADRCLCLKLAQVFVVQLNGTIQCQKFDRPPGTGRSGTWRPRRLPTGSAGPLGDLRGQSGPNRPGKETRWERWRQSARPINACAASR